jgi:hypothetical protein
MRCPSALCADRLLTGLAGWPDDFGRLILMDRVRNCAEAADASEGSERTQRLLGLAFACEELCQWLEQHQEADRRLSESARGIILLQPSSRPFIIRALSPARRINEPSLVEANR